MRLAVPVPVLLVLAVCMPAYAAPYGAPQTFPDIKQRSPAPLFGPIGWAIKGLVEGGEALAHYIHDRKSHHKRDFLEPRAERVQLLQLRSEVISYKSSSVRSLDAVH
ncbi:hypothetical protein F5887DRAFT_475941 [Amanita rubescens]|nr:hypothetical protein F5887DRAFT_475941 [Amanita rubescens]